MIIDFINWLDLTSYLTTAIISLVVLVVSFLTYLKIKSSNLYDETPFEIISRNPDYEMTLGVIVFGCIFWPLALPVLIVFICGMVLLRYLNLLCNKIGNSIISYKEDKIAKNKLKNEIAKGDMK